MLGERVHINICDWTLSWKGASKLVNNLVNGWVTRSVRKSKRVDKNMSGRVDIDDLSKWLQERACWQVSKSVCAITASPDQQTTNNKSLGKTWSTAACPIVESKTNIVLSGWITFSIWQNNRGLVEQQTHLHQSLNPCLFISTRSFVSGARSVGSVGCMLDQHPFSTPAWMHVMKWSHATLISYKMNLIVKDTHSLMWTVYKISTLLSTSRLSRQTCCISSNRAASCLCRPEVSTMIRSILCAGGGVRAPISTIPRELTSRQMGRSSLFVLKVIDALFSNLDRVCLRVTSPERNLNEMKTVSGRTLSG